MPTRRTLADLSGSPHATVFPEEQPRTIRLTLESGESVAPHSHPGHDVVLYVVRGHLSVDVDDETVPLEAGDVAHLDGDRSISPEAREESVALVVLAERADAP